MPRVEPPAFYGKLPGQGDFVGRGLSGRQEQTIDRWLAGWLGAAQGEWADAFDANYRRAQPWLYAGGRVSAIAIPSADRVGRLFPLLAAARAGAPIQVLYDTVVAAIEESWDGERLHRELGAIASGDEPGSAEGEWFVPDSDACAMPHPLSFESADAAVIGEMLS